MNEWISVKERLPKDNQLVACSYGSPYPFTAFYKKDAGFLQTDADTFWKTDEVTHWMPLPSPPKDLNEEI